MPLNLPEFFLQAKKSHRIIISSLVLLILVVSTISIVVLIRQRQEIRKYAQEYNYESEEEILYEIIPWPGNTFIKNFASPRGVGQVKEVTIRAHDYDGHFEARVLESTEGKFNINSGESGPDCEGFNEHTRDENCYQNHIKSIGCDRQKPIDKIQVEFTCETGAGCTGEQVDLKSITWVYCIPYTPTPTPTNAPTNTPTPILTPTLAPGGCGHPCRGDDSLCEYPYTCRRLPLNNHEVNPRNRNYECRNKNCWEEPDCNCKCDADASSNAKCEQDTCTYEEIYDMGTGYTGIFKFKYHTHRVPDKIVIRAIDNNDQPIANGLLWHTKTTPFNGVSVRWFEATTLNPPCPTPAPPGSGWPAGATTVDVDLKGLSNKVKVLVQSKPYVWGDTYCSTDHSIWNYYIGCPDDTTPPPETPTPPEPTDTPIPTPTPPPGVTETPTPTATSTPSPPAFSCFDLTHRGQIKIGQEITLVCIGKTGRSGPAITRFAFRVSQDHGGWEVLDNHVTATQQDNNPRMYNGKLNYLIPDYGHYRFECKPCIGPRIRNCADWPSN